MRDLAALTIVPVLSQIPSSAASWERLTVATASIAATVAVWRYFTARQDKRDQERFDDERRREQVATVERNRLLSIANDKNQEIVDLLKQQIADQQSMLRGESNVHAILENTSCHPVPVAPQKSKNP